MNHRSRFVFGLLVLCRGANSFAAGAPSQPALEGLCAACHGPGGRQPPSPQAPRLAGQQYAYLVHALDEYRSGARQSPIMGAMAKSLSDAQIETLARFYAAQIELGAK